MPGSLPKRGGTAWRGSARGSHLCSMQQRFATGFRGGWDTWTTGKAIWDKMSLPKPSGRLVGNPSRVCTTCWVFVPPESCSSPRGRRMLLAELLQAKRLQKWLELKWNSKAVYSSSILGFCFFLTPSEIFPFDILISFGLTLRKNAGLKQMVVSKPMPAKHNWELATKTQNLAPAESSWYNCQKKSGFKKFFE